MADVLLTHSYFLSFDPKEEKGMMPYPPLGTITAAAFVRSHGLSVALHDVMFSRAESDILSAIARHRPAVVVIYDDNFNYLTKMCLSRMREAAVRMATSAKGAGCTVLVFSSDATDHTETYLRNGVDYVLCGEAEQTLGELCDLLLGRSAGTMSDIKGIAYLEGTRVTRTPPRPVMKNLDTLPMAAWDLIDVERYRSAWMGRHGYFSLNVSTTRGCPFHCNWCAKPLYGQVYNSRSPGNVVGEMLHLKRTFHPDHLWITDDIFGLTPGWVAGFSRLVRERDAVIPFKCLSRADLLLEGTTIDELRSAGCSSVWMGAESGSQRVLDAMEKGTRTEQIRRATALLRQRSIGVGFFLQFGYPGELWEDIELTLGLVHDCMPDEIGISVSYPLPGTSFYERVKSDLAVKQNWIDSQDLDLMFAGEYPPDFYRALHRYVHKRFCIWRGFDHTRRTLTGAGPGIRRTLRSAASAVYHAPSLPFMRRKLRALRERPHPIHHDPVPITAGP